jgi:hypothetical protein
MDRIPVTLKEVFREIRLTRLISPCAEKSEPLPLAANAPEPMNTPLPSNTSTRFRVFDLVPNPPSEFGAATPLEADASQRAHLRFNDARNTLFLGADWLARMTKPNTGR